MLVADAWQARADALSSLVVATGLGGALIGFNFADALAAIIVGAMIVRAGLRFARSRLPARPSERAARRRPVRV